MKQPRIPRVGNWLEMNEGDLSNPILHQFLRSFSTSEMGSFDCVEPVELLVCERFSDEPTPAIRTENQEDTVQTSSTQSSSYYPPSSMGSRYSL